MAEDMTPEKLQRHCFMLYGIYTLSAALQISDDISMLGLSILTLAIAGHMCKTKKEAAKDTPYASHLSWLYRTAWIASCVAIPVNLGLSAALVWVFTDIGTIAHNILDGGDPETIASGLQSYIQNNETKISIFNMIGAAPPTIWWIHRCWRGYVLAKQGKPVENVMSWL